MASVHTKTPRTLTLASLTLAAAALTGLPSAQGQDYPYDDYVPELRKKKEYESKTRIPIERPRPTNYKEDSVFGVNVQGGALFTLQQEIDSTGFSYDSVTGPGYAVALGFGWDLQNHPISLELETGYQQHLLGNALKFGVIPLKFSTYYLNKLSDDAVLRIGVGTSLDFRLVTGASGVFPSWNLSMIYEYASFTFEPVLQIVRLRSGAPFLTGAFYFGYRI